MSEDLSRLPRWAQRRIERAERDLALHKERLSAGPENSNTFADALGLPRPLGKSPEIRFVISDNVYAEVRLEDSGRLRVALYGGGASSMAVLPWVTNVCYIEALTGDRR